MRNTIYAIYYLNSCFHNRDFTKPQKTITIFKEPKQYFQAGNKILENRFLPVNVVVTLSELLQKSKARRFITLLSKFLGIINSQLLNQKQKSNILCATIAQLIVYLAIVFGPNFLSLALWDIF